MVMVEIKCPRCGGIDVSKNGKISKDTQKYICNNKVCVNKSFLENYTYNGCKPGIDKQIIDMAANASGIRDTPRVLGISKQKVSDTLKKLKIQVVSLMVECGIINKKIRI